MTSQIKIYYIKLYVISNEDLYKIMSYQINYTYK